jgi:hypothetical protein
LVNHIDLCRVNAQLPAETKANCTFHIALKKGLVAKVGGNPINGRGQPAAAPARTATCARG